MNITLICWAASLLVLVPVLLGGLFCGMKRGALRSLVKLLALALSIVLAVVIAICLRSALTPVLSDLLISSLPESLEDQHSLITLIAQISAAILMAAGYLLIFMIVRLLMLIPQKIISSRLPKKYEELGKGKKNAPANAPAPPTPAEATVEATAEAENEVTAEATAEVPASAEGESLSQVAPAVEAPAESAPAAALPEATQPAPAKSSAGGKLLWKAGGALCGAFGALLFLSVLLIPLAGLITRSGEALYRVTDTLAAEGYGEYSHEISDYAHDISTAPLFSVPDVLLGKVVFEPLTTVPTEYGTVSLTKEMEIVTDALCKAMPAAIHVSDSGTLSREDAVLLSDAVDSVAKSDFMLSVGTWGATFAGDKLEDGADFKDSASKQALKDEVVDILEDMTPEALAQDLETLSELAEVLADSTVLKILASEEKKPDPSALADRETLRETFGILYDNDHTKNLLIPLINLGTEFIFKAIKAEPIYSDADIDDLSRDQILGEADRLCEVAENISAFTKSMEGEDKKLADYEMVSAGKALDSLKQSVLFGSQYKEVVKAVTSAGGSNENSALMDSLGDAIAESESAEKLLNSAQNVVIMSDALEDTSSKGRENEKLVSSLDVLLNDTSPKDADALSGIAGEHFLDNKENLDNDTKQQMLDDSMKALTAVCAKGSEDVEAEADAVQTFRDLTDTQSGNVFEEVSEQKTVDNFLASELAMEMLKNLNAENRDYGIREKLTEENKANITAALKNSSADEAKKLIVGQFFGVN